MGAPERRLRPRPDAPCPPPRLHRQHAAPNAFRANRAVLNAHADHGSDRPRRQRYVREPPRNIHERRLRQAERGIERELAELRVIRAAAELERDDPCRVAYEERFHVLAARSARRAVFRKTEFEETLAVTDERGRQEHGGGSTWPLKRLEQAVQDFAEVRFCAEADGLCRGRCANVRRSVSATCIADGRDTPNALTPCMVAFPGVPISWRRWTESTA